MEVDEEFCCLVRATDGKKKISTTVSEKSRLSPLTQSANSILKFVLGHNQRLLKIPVGILHDFESSYGLVEKEGQEEEEAKPNK